METESSEERLSNPQFDQVIYSEDGLTCSWIVDRHTCRIQSSDAAVIKRVRRWSLTKPLATWLNAPERGFTIPKAKWRWALRKLGLPEPDKKSGRVCNGRIVGRHNLKKGTESPGQISQDSLRAIKPKQLELSYVGL